MDPDLQNITDERNADLDRIRPVSEVLETTADLLWSSVAAMVICHGPVVEYQLDLGVISLQVGKGCSNKSEQATRTD